MTSGGVVLWLATIVFNLTYQAFNIGSNLWLTTWSTDANSESEEKRYYYLEIYSIYGLGQGFDQSFVLFCFFF